MNENIFLFPTIITKQLIASQCLKRTSSRINSELRFERAARTSAEIAFFDELQFVVHIHQKRGQESLAFDIRLTPVSALDAEARQHMRRLLGDLQIKISEILLMRISFKANLLMRLNLERMSVIRRVSGILLVLRHQHLNQFITDHSLESRRSNRCCPSSTPCLRSSPKCRTLASTIQRPQPSPSRVIYRRVASVADVL